MRITMAKALSSRVGAAVQMRSAIISSPLEKHTASLIFLHGSGDTGDNLHSYLNNAFANEFCFPHIQVIYPTAPFRRYTPMNGVPTTVWFNRPDITPYSVEDVNNVDEMCDHLDGLLAQEWNKHGIPASRIIVGGFSMGGALALHYAYRFCTDLAGVFALSTFLGEKSIVFEALKQHDGDLPPLYQTHGVHDQLVLAQWGGATHKRLRQLGVNGQYLVYPDISHEISELVVEGLRHWVLAKLPAGEQT